MAKSILPPANFQAPLTDNPSVFGDFAAELIRKTHPAFLDDDSFSHGLLKAYEKARGNADYFKDTQHLECFVHCAARWRRCSDWCTKEYRCCKSLGDPENAAVDSADKGHCRWSADELQMAYDCLLKLPPLDAIILIARYYSEWTDRRIAVQLLGLEDCSAATQRAFRLRNKALQRLRTILLAHGLNGE